MVTGEAWTPSSPHPSPPPTVPSHPGVRRWGAPSPHTSHTAASVGLAPVGLATRGRRGCAHDGAVHGTEVRALRKGEHRAAAAVTARALADSPTAVAIYGADPLDGLAGLYGELGPFFGLLPSPQMAAFTGDCVIAAAIAPPGGCIGSFVSGGASDELIAGAGARRRRSRRGATSSGRTGPRTTSPRTTGT